MGLGAFEFDVTDANGDGYPDVVASDYQLGAITAINRLRDLQTPTLLTIFEASPVVGGIEVRFALAVDPPAPPSLDRSEPVVGPWQEVRGETRTEGFATVVLDREVEDGTRYFFRLRFREPDGAIQVFGPIEAVTLTHLRESALLSVTPNPGQDRIIVRFAVGRPGHVRLAVHDLQGRGVATLSDREFLAGEHAVTWNRTSGSPRLRSGIYFVRLEIDGRTWTARVALLL